MFEFRIIKQSAGSRARLGVLKTPHGEIMTPAFMPVGTQGTVKTVSPRELEELGAGIILANTYHLYLRPGAEIVAAAGGLHRFMSWPHAILTDSGGYQVMSLGALRQISDEGVRFRSHIDGSEHFFTPELAVAVQEALGSDIAMVLDDVPPYPAERERVAESVRRTAIWAERARAVHRRPDQAQFGIVQGGVWPDLRVESARAITAIGFDGYAVGGLSVGEPKPMMYEMLDVTVPFLPADRVRYLMGVGTPDVLVEAVRRGVDIFDCVLPTRVARHAMAMTRHGRLVIKSRAFATDFSPIEDGCSCYTCQHFSRAYIRHLFHAREALGLRLVTIHNLAYLLRFMQEMRDALAREEFETWAESAYAGWAGDPLGPGIGRAPDAGLP